MEEQRPERPGHARIIAAPEAGRVLDTVQLRRLEESFRQWATEPRRADVRQSRRRILLLFLLIRYTGAKLHEVLGLDPWRGLNPERPSVSFGQGETGPPREVRIPERLALEMQAAFKDPAFQQSLGSLLQVDPGHVRRKFYARAAACGFAKQLGGPDALRKARALELMQNNLPLPVVQNMLGHSTPSLTASMVSFSEDDIQEVARLFLDRESRRQTSARNSFFGKISRIKRGDIQAKVELVTVGGHGVETIITNDSLARLGLRAGLLISAEVKAPMVILQKGEAKPRCSAENIFAGRVERIIRGKVTTEIVVKIPDGTELCSLVSSEASRRLELRQGEPVWVMFNSFGVVLHLE